MSDNIDSIVGDDVNTAPDSTVNEDTSQDVTTEGSDAADKPAADRPEAKQEPKTVPLAALHEARQELKQQRAEFVRLREEQAARDAKIQERLDAFTRAQQPPEPTIETDPARYLDNKLTGVTNTLEAQQKAYQERQQAEQQQHAWSRIASAVQMAEDGFMKATPDYHESVGYLREMRVRELTEGFGVDPHAAAQQAQKELLDFAVYNVQRGANPAEAAYRMATVRGYAKKAPEAAGTAPAEKLAAQQKGAAAKSIGGGGAPTGQLTVEALLKMSDEEFESVTKDDKWRKVAGG